MEIFKCEEGEWRIMPLISLLDHKRKTNWFCLAAPLLEEGEAWLLLMRCGKVQYNSGASFPWCSIWYYQLIHPSLSFIFSGTCYTHPRSWEDCMILEHIRIFLFTRMWYTHRLGSNAAVPMSFIIIQKSTKSVGKLIPRRCGNVYVGSTCYHWLKRLLKFTYFNTIHTSYKMS